MKTTAQKWGIASPLRCPSVWPMGRAPGEGCGGDRGARRGRCVVQPHLRLVYRLEDLLKCIRPRHVHEEVGFSEPVGR